jgi:hypothetical protein
MPSLRLEGGGGGVITLWSESVYLYFILHLFEFYAWGGIEKGRRKREGKERKGKERKGRELTGSKGDAA